MAPRIDLTRPGTCALIGMVHLRPLPGSPNFDGDVAAIVADALLDANALIDGGCDSLMVENMGDVPYLKGTLPPEGVATAAVVVSQLVRLGVPVGVQMLAAANREALGVAVSAGAAFIRVEGFAYAHVADEGWIDACAGELLRARALLRADVQIWADVQKKHAAHAVTQDLSIEELAKGSAFCGADALIVTGTSTGEATNPEHVVAASRAGLPIAVGSGVTPENAAELSRIAQALIVGTWLKQDGNWRNRVDPDRVRALKQVIEDAR